MSSPSASLRTLRPRRLGVRIHTPRRNWLTFGLVTNAATATETAPLARPAGFSRIDALMAVMVLVWGVNYSIIKVSMREIEPLAFNAVRFALAATTLAIIAWLSGARMPSRGDLPKLALLGIIGNAVYQYGFIEGVAHTRAGNAALIMAAVPVETAVLSHLLGHERLRRRDVLALMVSAVGIATIVLGSGKDVAFGGSIRGDLLIFGATLCWSVYIIGCKPFADSYGPVTSTAWTIGLGSIVLIGYSIPAVGAQHWSAVSGPAWAGLLFSTAGALVLSYLIWFQGLRHLGPTRTAIYSNFTPVVVMLSAWPILGERPTLWQLAGAAGIFTGLWLTRT